MSNVPVPYYNKSTADVKSFTDYMRDMTKANIAANAMFAEDIKSTLVTGQKANIAANAMFANDIKSTLVNNQIATEQALFNHTQEINATLIGGFSDVGRQIGEMTSAMNMGFAFLSGAVLKSSKAICDKLDDINETLKSPLLIESMELYNRALKNYTRKLYEEVLEDLQEALKKNKTEPRLYFLMGQTYLSGISEDCNVIDLNKSVEALKNAAKYIRSDAETYPEVRPMAAEINFCLGLAHYIKANDAFRNSNEPDYLNHIEEAKAAYRKSWDYSQNMLESLYNLARCEALSDEADVAIPHLITAMTRDNGYCVKAATESDFDKVFLDKLFSRLKSELYPETKDCFDKIKNVMADFQTPYSSELAQLVKNHLPDTFTENTPPFDMLIASAVFPKILERLQIEKNKEKERVEWERREEQKRMERERRNIREEQAREEWKRRDAEKKIKEEQERAEREHRKEQAREEWKRSEAEKKIKEEIKEKKKRRFWNVFSIVLGVAIGMVFFAAVAALSTSNHFVWVLLLLLALFIGLPILCSNRSNNTSTPGCIVGIVSCIVSVIIMGVGFDNLVDEDVSVRHGYIIFIAIGAILGALVGYINNLVCEKH